MTNTYGVFSRVASDPNRCSLNIWFIDDLSHLFIRLSINWIVVILWSKHYRYKGGKAARVTIFREFRI